jgi:hypothetical protein
MTANKIAPTIIGTTNRETICKFRHLLSHAMRPVYNHKKYFAKRQLVSGSAAATGQSPDGANCGRHCSPACGMLATMAAGGHVKTQRAEIDSTGVSAGANSCGGCEFARPVSANDRLPTFAEPLAVSLPTEQSCPWTILRATPPAT